MRRGAPRPEGREDLRDLPLVTIDPWMRATMTMRSAETRPDPGNPGGLSSGSPSPMWRITCAPASALDREARKRGNSTYFPDRVVPMLPDRLSGDLCSLHEGVDRALPRGADADRHAQGHKISHRFVRGMMRSAASLPTRRCRRPPTGPDERCARCWTGDRPLYAAYAALCRRAPMRQPLDLDLPERKIVLCR
jgi:ribonuclease R